jgi:hypothetical protein
MHQAVKRPDSDTEEKNLNLLHENYTPKSDKNMPGYKEASHRVPKSSVNKVKTDTSFCRPL